jgi:hypothetical protein
MRSVFEFSKAPIRLGFQSDLGAEETMMTKHATLDAIAKADTIARSSQIAPWRPALSMRWALDPTTAKPMARWIIEGSEEIRSLAA